MGTVIWFDPKAGYGFVKPDGGGLDAFVCRSTKGSRHQFGRRRARKVTSGKVPKTEVVVLAKAI